MQIGNQASLYINKLGDSLYGFSFDGWFVNYNWSCFEFDFEKAAKSTIFPLTLE